MLLIYTTKSIAFTFIAPPKSLHAVPMQRHSRQFTETLPDVEVAQGADFEERHVILGSIHFCITLLHLPFEGEM